MVEGKPCHAEVAISYEVQPEGATVAITKAFEGFAIAIARAHSRWRNSATANA